MMIQTLLRSDLEKKKRMPLKSFPAIEQTKQHLQ